MTRNYLDILAETIRNNWDQPALTDFYLTDDGTAQDTSRGNHYTYGEMYTEIVRVAKLLTRLGLSKADHIAICGANSAHWAIAYLAIAKMQGVSVTVMHSLMPEEIAHLVDFSDAKALFVDAELWAEISRKPLPQVKNVIALDDWSSLNGQTIQVNAGQLDCQEVAFQESNPDDLAMICFTSATTGTPKGVMLSYRTISHGISVSSKTFPVCTRQNYLSILPYSHIFGVFGEITDQLLCAHHIYVCREIDKLAESIKVVRPFVLMLVPFYLETIISKGIIQQLECGWINIGGGHISSNVALELNNGVLPHLIMYGSTECLLASNTLPQQCYIRNCVGRACDNVEIITASNGEILTKGENVMLGYYKDPEATARKIDAHGWLHTGDCGYLDEDGNLYVEGRLKQDMIVLPNGENIRPDNIESLINALPEVAESIVLARDGKLISIVVPKAPIDRKDILRAINPQLPLFSQLYDIELTDTPLARTEKQTLKRYLYK